jgi:DNA-binding protein
MTEQRQNRQSSDKIKISVGRSVFYFVDEAAEALKQHPQIELSGLGSAINTVVSVADILRHQGLAKIKKVNTTMLSADNRRVQKAKIEIVLERAPTFEAEFAKKQALAKEKQDLRRDLEEGRKRVQEELKKLSSQTPQ